MFIWNSEQSSQKLDHVISSTDQIYINMHKMQIACVTSLDV